VAYAIAGLSWDGIAHHAPGHGGRVACVGGTRRRREGISAMTERKSFKKIVRTRMSRTGETYSTASRHVSARRDTVGAPPALVAGYPEPVRCDHHDAALVARLLGQVGLDVDETLASGLGGGIGFMYAIFDYKAVSHPLLTIVAQHHPQPWAPAVLDRLAITYTEQNSSSTNAAMGKLRAVLDAGRAALCTVDRSLFPWHTGVSPVGVADPAIVVVAGIDGGTLYVDDGDGGTHNLTAAEFGTAWASHRKGRHQLLSIADVPDEVEVQAGIREAIRATVAHLTGPVLGNAFDVNFGLSGMAKLAAELRERRTKVAWSRRFGEPEGFHHAMRRLDDCLEREYTASGATRGIYAEFLQRAGFAREAALFRASGERWSALAARARAAADSGVPDESGLRELLDGFAADVEACIDDERRGAGMLGESVGTGAGSI